MKGRSDVLLRTTKLCARACLFPFFRVVVRGEDTLPKDTGFVLLPKHQRWEDIPLLGLACPRPLYYVAKHELFENPLSGWFLRSVGGLPLNRTRPLQSRRSLKAVVHHLSGGEGVVVFPEGTYRRGHMGQGHLGMIRLVISRVNLPVIPVGLRYVPEGGEDGGACEFRSRAVRRGCRIPQTVARSRHGRYRGALGVERAGAPGMILPGD